MLVENKYNVSRTIASIHIYVSYVIMLLFLYYLIAQSSNPAQATTTI